MMRTNVLGRDHGFIVLAWMLTLSFFLAACASQSLRIQSDVIPANALRIAQTVAIAKRDEIIRAKPTYDAIVASGISDSEIVDGSVVVARVYCCGGLTKEFSSEHANAIVLFVPRGLNVARGDMVEVKVGSPQQKDAPGSLNIVTRVVQKAGSEDQNCWWDPRDDRLWLRVLYCNWMPSEGWVKQGGISPAWYKPPPSGSDGQ